MHGMDSVDGFDLDDDAFFDKEVDSIACLNLDLVVYDRQTDFMPEGQSTLCHLMRETFCIDRLEQAGAEIGMDPKGAVKNTLRPPVM